MKSTIKKIERRISEKLRETGFRRLVVGVSGGADSVALLTILKAIGTDITAAHCNFHLRGDESQRDEEYVRRLCADCDVPLHVVDFNVDSYIMEHPGKSVEMACRELRYEWFFRLIEKIGGDRLATAHNADDNIETLFLNLLRGSGTRGLRGMLADNGRIWRPLLDVPRTEIEAYLKEKGIPFMTDSTNLESDYRRNFLRNEVLPMLRSRWEGFNKALARSIGCLCEENAIVEKALSDALPSSGETLSVSDVVSFPSPELLVRRFIDPAGPFSTTASEVVSAIRADKPDSKRWRLRKGELLLRNGKLFIKKDV